jgi:hypothetical protein
VLTSGEFGRAIAKSAGESVGTAMRPAARRARSREGTTTVSNRADRRPDVKDILVILPQMRDLRSIDHAGLGDRFRVRYVDPDFDPSQPFDAIGYLDRVARIPADGIVATHDNAALLAALVAQRRGVARPDTRSGVRVPVQAGLPRTPERRRAGCRPALRDPRPVGRLRAAVLCKAGLRHALRRCPPDRRPAQLAQLDGNDHARDYARVAEMMGLTVADSCGYLAEELLSGDEVTR